MNLNRDGVIFLSYYTVQYIYLLYDDKVELKVMCASNSDKEHT